MRRMHREALDRFSMKLEAGGGPGLPRIAKMDRGEKFLERISTEKSSQMLFFLMHPESVMAEAGNMQDLYQFLRERVLAEVNFRIPTPAVEPE